MTHNVPPSCSGPVALVLGGLTVHVAVVERLNALGYYTILLDYGQNPPAAAVAGKHLCISTLDRDAVLAAAREWNAVVVVNACLDQAVPVGAYVSKILGLPTLHSPELAHKVTNKDAMKTQLAQNAIATANWRLISDPSEMAGHTLQFPLVAKPVAGTGSQGVVFVRSEAELAPLLEQVFAIAKNQSVLVEEFIDGPEVNLDCFVVQGKMHVLLCRERHMTWLEGATRSQCHGSVAPAQLLPEQVDQLEHLAQEIAHGFSIKDGPVMIQAILPRNGGLPVVLEMAARIGGGSGSNRMVRLKTGIDYINAAIDLQLGRPVSLTPTHQKGHYGASYFYATNGSIAEVTGLEELISDGVIETYDLYRWPGDKMGDQLGPRSRVGSFVLRAKSRAALKQSVQEVFSHIDVLDKQGKSIMCRKIGLHLSLQASSWEFVESW